MNEEKLKNNISQNLCHYRKLSGITQAELAEKLNYSDKSVSKWERGDGLPDVIVLTEIAELFGVTLNDLVADYPPPETPKKDRHSKKKKILVPIISSILPLFVGTLAYFILTLLFENNSRLWLIFVYSVAASAVVLIVFAHLWWNKVFGGVFVSSLIWIAAVCVFFTWQRRSIWLIFIVTAVLQIIVILWYILIGGKRAKNKKQKDKKD